MVVLLIHAVRYRDLNALNNQLLLDIKAELRHLRGKDPALSLDEIDHMPPADSDTLQMIRRVTQSRTSALADGTEDDESDSAWSSSSDLSDSDESSSRYTDVSYRPNLRATEMGDNSSTASLSYTSIDKEELEFLRNSTPLHDGKFQSIQTWNQAGYYVTDTRDGSSAVSPSSPGSSMSKYNLRQRTPTQIMNPALREESPKTFGRQVKNLQRLAMKNSTAMREGLMRVIADSQYRKEEKN